MTTTTSCGIITSLVTTYIVNITVEVDFMINASIGSVRRAVEQHVGSKVLVKSNLGRHRYDVTEGIITDTYPCIFLVQVKNKEEDSVQTLSYSYSDVIAQDVQLKLCV